METLATTKTLRGRAIGLKAIMTKEQMLEHLRKIAKEWEAEGFSKNEVFQAITSKIRPLAYGFYWYRNPEAQINVREAYKEFSIEYTGKEIERFEQVIKNNNQQNGVKKVNNEAKRAQLEANLSWLDQF